jgi:hypothetical protein
MDRDDDVERLFSWLKTPELRYREFADERDVADTMPTWPSLQRTAEAGQSTATHSDPEVTPAQRPTVEEAPPSPAPLPPVAPPRAPIMPPRAAPIVLPRPPIAAPRVAPSRPTGVPAGDRLMSALGRRVRAARQEQGHNGLMQEEAAEELQSPSEMAAAAGIRGQSVSIAAGQRVAEDRALDAAEEARIAAEHAAAEEARLAAEHAAEEARLAAEHAAALRRQRETVVAHRTPPRPPLRIEEPIIQRERQAGQVAAQQRMPTRPGSDRPSLFGGGYRDGRPATTAPGSRSTRPLAAVLSRISEPEEQPAVPVEPPPSARLGGIFGRIR